MLKQKSKFILQLLALIILISMLATAFLRSPSQSVSAQDDSGYCPETLSREDCAFLATYQQTMRDTRSFFIKNLDFIFEFELASQTRGIYARQRGPVVFYEDSGELYGAEFTLILGTYGFEDLPAATLPIHYQWIDDLILVEQFIPDARESALFQLWNRFFDPSTYLTPDLLVNFLPSPSNETLWRRDDDREISGKTYAVFETEFPLTSLTETLFILNISLLTLDAESPLDLSNLTDGLQILQEVMLGSSIRATQIISIEDATLYNFIGQIQIDLAPILYLNSDISDAARAFLPRPYVNLRVQGIFSGYNEPFTITPWLPNNLPVFTTTPSP